MLQHILNKYPIPSGRILHKHMRHRPDQLPILYNRRSRHALNDSAGKGQKLRIRHFNYHALTFVSGGIIHLQDLNIVIFYRPGNAAADSGFSRLDILTVADGKSLGLDAAL